MSEESIRDVNGRDAGDERASTAEGTHSGALHVDARDAALVAARAADEKKATDIMVQEVGDLIGVTEYFVIVTAQNSRQVDAIIDEIEEKLLKDAGLKPMHREVSQDGSWSLLDYGNLVVHVFQPETREYYRLETLWNDAPIVDLTAEEGFENLEYSERIAKMLGGMRSNTDGDGNGGAQADIDSGTDADVESDE